MDNQEIKDRFRYVKTWAGPVFVLVMFVAALWFLHLELQRYGLQDFVNGLTQIPALSLLLAILLTLLNYAILVCYDWLGIWYIRHPMRFGRVALASFLGYAVGNNFGLLFGGSTIRYRLYSTWGLSAGEIVKLLFVLAITFWIGLFALSGVVFLIEPLPIPAAIGLPMQTTKPLGIVLTGLAIGYLLLSAMGKPLKLGSREFAPPPLGLSIMQYLVASIDLLVAAGIVYVLLPESVQTSYFHFVAIFLLAQVAVFVTQVPGGLGVLELSLLTLLAPSDKGAVVGALLAYRLIFYLTPMMIGVSLLGVHELATQRAHLSRALKSVGKWTPDIAPRFAAVTVFLCGVAMLFSSALPVATRRIELLNSVLPLWSIEFSYFMSAIVGVVLLLLARGLNRRIRMAYVLTLPVLVLGVVFALAGSLGYVQAMFLLIAQLVVSPIPRYFHRRGKLFSDRIAYHWLIAITVVLVTAVWLFWFAYKETGADFDLTRVALDADAARSLRSILGASLLASGFLVVRVLQISVGRPESTTRRELIAAQTIVHSSHTPTANLALLGDKQLLFNEQQTAMVMYAASGNSCVALGNPIGPTEDAIQLAWDFGDLCNEQGAWPVFYSVDDRFAALYQEMNLRLFHIGDEAVVDLREFEIADPKLQAIAEPHRRITELGMSFEVLEVDAIPSLLPDLERINAAWLKDAYGGEGRAALQGFANSFFSEEFIKRNPLAIVRHNDRIVAFASVWKGADRDVLTADLVRVHPECATGMLEFLFVETMCWAQSQGFRFFSLGTAPLAKEHLEEHERLWTLLMSLAFRFSEHFYSELGLRNYKARFDPNWRPVYVAFSRDRSVDGVLNELSALVGSRRQFQG